MTDERKFSPDWENSDNWQEYEWENALKYNDHITSRFFRMMERYGDLPDAEELIATRLGDYGMLQFDDFQWDDELYNDTQEIEEPKTDISNETIDSGETDHPDSYLFYENSPVYQQTRQLTLGWCNIIASALDTEDRFWGVKVLFYFGRLLSYISLSIGDGTFEQLNGSIILAKRALGQTNEILGEIQSKADKSERYLMMFRIVNDHLLEIHDALVDYLVDCKKRQKDDNISG